MALDPSIILAGQPVNALGAITAANQAAAGTNQIRTQNALAQLYKTQGAGLMNGDPNALNALAAIDPAAAQGMAVSQAQLDKIRTDAKNAAADRAASMDAAKAKADADRIEKGVAMGLSVKSPQEWDAMMTQFGAPELVGQFDNRMAIAHSFLGIADALKAAQGPAPLSPQGKFEADKAAGLLPAGATYQSGGTTVNVGGENSSEFGKESDKKAAGRLSDIVDQGRSAQIMTGDLSRLADLAKVIGTGKGAEVLAAIGPYAQALGVDVSGLGEAQAFQAIVDRMAPNLRPAGSGATSDFDARQFLSSLPGLGKDPNGNKIIVDTLQAIQKNKIDAAEIANKAFSGEISWQEADRRIAALPNPYAAFKGGASGGGSGATVVDGFTIEEVK